MGEPFDMVCEICGNEREGSSSLRCRFCGHKYEQTQAPDTVLHRIINLEIGRPHVEIAMDKLDSEIARAKQERVALLTIIHGYGSSGNGGVIREECRKVLAYYLSKKRIKGYIPGENFTRKEGGTKRLLRKYPQFTSNSNLNRGNKGVTLVELL